MMCQTFHSKNITLNILFTTEIYLKCKFSIIKYYNCVYIYISKHCFSCFCRIINRDYYISIYMIDFDWIKLDM